MESSVACLTAKSRLPLHPAKAWLDHLNEHGFVVIQGVLEPERLNSSVQLLKRDMGCGIGGHHGISGALAQSEGAWDVRRSLNIRQAFSEIWETDDLLVSMDCVIARDAHTEAATEGLHLDQNPFTKPHRECVQGMVPLLAVTPATGGLEVVPGSHKQKDRQKKCLKEYLRHEADKHDFCILGTNQVPRSECIARLLSDEGNLLAKELEREALLPCAEPGDLILWDSRTVHGGRVPDNHADTSGLPVDFHRIACTVSMTPRAFADAESLQDLRSNGTLPKDCRPGMSTAVLETRVQKYDRRAPTNHSPHDSLNWGMHSSHGPVAATTWDQSPYDIKCLLLGVGLDDKMVLEALGERLKLKVKTVAELRSDAEAIGVSKEAILDVLDSEDVRDELITLIVQAKSNGAPPDMSCNKRVYE